MVDLNLFKDKLDSIVVIKAANFRHFHPFLALKHPLGRVYVEMETWSVDDGHDNYNLRCIHFSIQINFTTNFNRRVRGKLLPSRRKY